MKNNGMRILLFLFLLCFLACTKNDDNDPIQIPPPPPAVEETSPISYLALGDSYTIGQNVETSERFPVQLVERLRADGIEMEDARIIATTGWRTDNLINSLAATNVQDTFDLVSLLIGVNNQFQGRPVDVYKMEFTELLQTSIGLAGGEKNHVFVLSIPDYAFTTYGENSNNAAEISQEIDAFNAVNKAVTDSIGVRYFDITPISRMGIDEPELVASDGLHPSGEQYRRWVELFYEEIKMLVD